jgi:hypothetical protein
MALQNRVTPYGELVAVDARGTFFGNRGRLHDEQRRIRRHHDGKRWIVCVLEFKGRHREVMQPNRYTELFFLDEATALAAGHRPCAECRRDAFNDYRGAWATARGLAWLPTAGELDDVLHGERGRLSASTVAALPDGAMVDLEGGAYVVRHGLLWPWAPAGYGSPRPAPRGEVAVITPPATVATIAAGYQPVIHQSTATTP